MCQSIAAAASYMDGGAAHPLQKAALPLVSDLNWVRQDIISLQKHFRMKRDLFLEVRSSHGHAMLQENGSSLLTESQGILKLGIKIDMVPQGTFYVWADLSDLPHPLNDGITFFEECIKEKLICVPGIFFDINPVCKLTACRRYSQWLDGVLFCETPPAHHHVLTSMYIKSPILTCHQIL